MTQRQTCPSCSASVGPEDTVCGNCGKALTVQRRSVGATVQMDSFDRPTLIAGVTPGQTEPRASESASQARMVEALKAATAGEYQIVRELGRGGMAIVYQAHDLSLDREVAIKVMSPALLDGEGAVERFKREARTAAGLSHPHIIPIHAVREAGEVLYFVMKYVEGRPLDSVLQRQGALPIPMAVQILSEVASALAYAHKRGVIHRDVKPANIMLDDGGWAVVADFGIAKVTEKRGLTQTGTTVGTPAYMSPEQFTLKDIDGRSDQYSLGIVAFELLTGRTPFDAESMVEMYMAHSSAPPPPVRTVRPDCPPELATIVERMIAKSPANRFESLDLVVQALSGLQTTESRKQVRSSMLALARVEDAAPVNQMAATTPSSPVPFAAPVSTQVVPSRRGRWAALAAGILVVALGGWWYTGQRDDSVVTPAGSGGPIIASRPAVAKVELPPRATLAVNGSAQLTIALRDSFNTVITGRPILWTSSDTNVATVDTTGTVRAKRAGRTIVAATSEGQSASSAVEVTDQAIVAKSIALVAADSSVDAGAKVTVLANVADATGANLVGQTITWRSSDPAVAAVDLAGVVTTLKPGTATITAAVMNGPRSTLRLTVVPTRAAVAALAVSQSSFALTVGDTANPRATVTDARNAILTDRDVVWSTDHPDVLQVDRLTGRAIAIKEGDARILATVDSVARGISVTVKRAAATTTSAPASRSDSTTDASVGSVPGAPMFTEISAGGSTTCGALVNDGGVLCWGAAGLNGALLQGVIFDKIAVGDAHTCGLTPGGDAQCWGTNSMGQLGDGSTTNRDKPVAVQGNLRFTDISVGAAHSCGLTEDGSAYCWGGNKFGQLGDGSERDRRTPVLVRSTAGNKGFQSLAAGGAHTCAVTRANKAYCWGDGFSGQVGNAMTSNANEPFAVKTELEFKTVVAGGKHTCGLSTRGRAYCWGNNRDGQLGNDNKDDRDTPDSVATDQIFLTIASGADHACGISAQKKLYCWGKNADGRVGDGTRIARTAPVVAGGGQTFSLISAGAGHTCALTARGQAMCWGTNSRGQLGSGAVSAFSPSPVTVKVKGGD